MIKEDENLERAYDKMHFCWQEAFMPHWQKGYSTRVGAFENESAVRQHSGCRIKKDRGHDLGLTIFMAIILCLQLGIVQVYAQKNADDERVIRYSSSYQKESEIPDAPKEYDEGKLSYRLVETAVEAVPVIGRNKEVSGEIVYESVTKKQEIPEKAPMKIEDKESFKTLEAVLSLRNTTYLNERWQDGYEISVIFHEYGADTYSLGEVKIAHDSEKPPLDECRKELIENAGLSEDEIQIESVSWDGDAYQDEDDIWCRNATVKAKQRVWDCRAVYGGTVELPEYNRFRMRMEYEQVKPDVTEVKIQGTDENLLGETEADFVEDISLPFWKRWIRYGITISVSLFLILLGIIGFHMLRRIAKEKEKN